MAYQLIEQFDSRDATDSTDKSSSVDLKWYIQSSTDAEARDDLAIKAYVGVNVPIAYDGLLLRTIKHSRLGPRIGEVVVHYVDPEKQDEDEQKETGEYKFSFDTTGGQQHVSQSKETISKTAIPGQEAPDFKGAINVSGDRVDGVDLVIPALKFQLTYKVPQATLTTDYVRTLARMTGTTNADEFLGFAAGELLFLGATGEQALNGDPEVTYHFEASENIVNQAIGDIVVPAKKGHEFLWVWYQPEEDDNAKRLVQRPFAAYVERVYRSTNFSDLGLEV